MTHKGNVARCSPHATGACIGQVTSHTFHNYAIAAGLGAAAGLALVTILLILWQLAIRPLSAG